MLVLSSVWILGLAGMVALPSPYLASQPVQEGMACIVMNRRGFENRPSPLDSLSFTIGGHEVKICYGRPSARGRTMIGGDAVPFGRLWRTGANEPTMVHSTTALSIAGIEVGPGTYSLYTIPNEEEWVLLVNRSIDQWGHEGRYSAEVKAQEVGQAVVSSESNDQHVETLTFRAEPTGTGATVILEWENTRVRIPVTAGTM